MRPVNLSLILFLILFSVPALGLDTHTRLVGPQISWKTSDLTHFNHEWVQVKFVEGSNARLDFNQFSDTSRDLSSVNETLGGYSIISSRPTFSIDRSTLRDWKAQGEARSGAVGPDLSLWYNLQISGGPSEVARLVNELNQLSSVEIAHPIPIVEPAVIYNNGQDISFNRDERPYLTPDFSSQQGYLYDTPVGLDAPSVWTIPGGLGQDISFIDVELCWTEDHEDFAYENCFYIGGSPQNPNYETHGTAVLGEVIGQHNGLGVKGFAPAVDYGVVAIDINLYPDVAQYFLEAVNHLEAGDVWLIELQMYPGELAATPMEWLQVNYDVIWTSVWARNIVCVEAGANGSQDLDDPIWGGIFDRDQRDSGAIMVGAGTPTGRVAEYFTNYGSRMDVNAWGSQIVTTAYGDLYDGGTLQTRYTSAFGGTSGASPMIVGSCLALQGIAKSSLGMPLDPIMLRSILHDNGTPHLNPAKEIGPRPDLNASAAAIISMGANPFLTHISTVIDDDNSGQSQGNNNGTVDYNETVELTINLSNIGHVDGVDITGQLSSTDDYITITTSDASFGTIPADGGEGGNQTPFIFSVNPDVPDGHQATLTLSLSESPGFIEIILDISAPSIGLSIFVISDDAGGNGNGVAEPGESITLELTLTNNGGATAVDLVGTLTGDAYLFIDESMINFGTITPGGEATCSPISITISPDCPNPYPAPLALDLSGTGFVATTIDFSIFVGLFADDFENGDAAWSHYSATPGHEDQWHLETYRNHTPDGDTSWKCGGAGGSDHTNNLWAILESTSFFLPANSTLNFWHWLDAEISAANPGFCYDGGFVEISIDGGDWEAITPEGGYPYLIMEQTNPFPAETPVYSGTFSWEEASFDLAGYEGACRVRFVFGSDGAVTQEGWYIDDLSLAVNFSGTGDNEQLHPLTLHTALPNPTTNITSLKLDLPVPAAAQVAVYDASGRHVRTIVAKPLDAGRHTISWSGLDKNNAAVPAGIYWLKARVSGFPVQSRRVVIVR